MGTGKWRYAQHVFAGDRHNEPAHDHKDAPEGGLILIPVPLAVRDEGTNGSPPEREQHLKWGLFNEFDQGVNLAKVNPPFKLSATSKHPASDSLVELSTDRKGSTGADPFKIFTTEAIIHLKGKATATANIEAESETEKIFADSYAAGEIKLRGDATKATITDHIEKKVIVKTEGRASSFSGGATSVKDQKATFDDPVSLEIFDAVTGDLVAAESLFKQHWLATDDASVEWDEGGLILSTGEVGMASIEIGTPSHWVLDQFIGSASLTNGLLSTSGAFAGLGWIVNTVDGITTATLPLGDLSSQFTLDLGIDGLEDQVNDLLFELRAPAQGFASEGAEVVPEPATLLLLLWGAGLLAGDGAVRRRLRSACNSFAGGEAAA